MGERRHAEKWGTIAEIDVGRCERGLIYDGHQSSESREYQRRRGQDTWALVKFDDGTESWEPVWWFLEKETHLEYQV